MITSVSCACVVLCCCVAPTALHIPLKHPEVEQLRFIFSKFPENVIFRLILTELDHLENESSVINQIKLRLNNLEIEVYYIKWM